MRRLILALSLVLAAPMAMASVKPHSAHAVVKVMSFREWKTSEVRSMKDRVLSHKKELKDLVGKEFVTAEDLTVERIRIEGQLAQAEYNMEVVQELSVNDYFVLYLSRFEQKAAAFLAAAQKLEDAELAELMMAYDKHLSGRTQDDDPKAAWMGELRPVN